MNECKENLPDKDFRQTLHERQKDMPCAESGGARNYA